MLHVNIYIYIYIYLGFRVEGLGLRKSGCMYICIYTLIYLGLRAK